MSEKDSIEKLDDFINDVEQRLQAGEIIPEKEFEPYIKEFESCLKDMPQLDSPLLSSKPKRNYTMTPAAREARRKNGQKPKKRRANHPIATNWRHGRYARSLSTSMKPCHATCKKYPCEYVTENKTRPGDFCLDAEGTIHFFRAVLAAVGEGRFDEFEAVSALTLARSMAVLNCLLEDIQRDGTIIKKMKHDKDGKEISFDVVSHPSLFTVPKLLQALNMPLSEFLLTPKSRAKLETEDEVVGGLADLLSSIGKRIKKKGDSDGS